MKTIVKKAGLVLGVAGLITLGVGNVRAGEVEYRNAITLDKFISAMEDTSDYRVCYYAAPRATAVAANSAARYKNMTDLDRFIAALKDQTEVEYKNVFTVGTFVAALEGPKAPEYKNTANIESFVAALKDPLEVEYRNIIDLERFVTALKDNSGDLKALEIVCENSPIETGLHANSGMILIR